MSKAEFVRGFVEKVRKKVEERGGELKSRQVEALAEVTAAEILFIGDMFETILGEDTVADVARLVAGKRGVKDIIALEDMPAAEGVN